MAAKEKIHPVPPIITPLLVIPLPKSSSADLDEPIPFLLVQFHSGLRTGRDPQVWRVPPVFNWLSLLELIGSVCLSDWLSLDPKTFLKRMLGFPVLTAVYHTLDHMCLHVPACACIGDAFLLLANDAKCLVMAQLL